MQPVLIFRSELLPISETFIVAQAQAMERWQPVFAGVRRVAPSLPMPFPSLIVAEGNRPPARLRRFLYQTLGWSPAWMQRAKALAPAVLHAHFALDGCEALPLARSLRVPLVVTLHGYDVMRDDEAHAKTPRGRLYLRRRAELFKVAALFLCVSEAIRQRALAHGFPAGKLRVHPIGVAPPRAVHDTRVREPLVLFVGRLVEKKGCLHLLRAMRQVQEAVPEARLLIAGEGPLRPSLEQAAGTLGVRAEFVGGQSREQVHEWMTRSRVLALPSITARDGDAEGLPTVLGEALARGLPVAAFASSGIPEMARHAREALLCEEADESGLAQHIIRLCEDDALASQLGAAGRRRIADHFDLGEQTRKLELVYDELLAANAVSLAGATKQRAPLPGTALQAGKTHEVQLEALAAAADELESAAAHDPHTLETHALGLRT